MVYGDSRILSSGGVHARGIDRQRTLGYIAVGTLSFAIPNQPTDCVAVTTSIRVLRPRRDMIQRSKQGETNGMPSTEGGFNVESSGLYN